MDCGDNVVQISDDESSEDDAIIINSGSMRSNDQQKNNETIVIDDENVPQKKLDSIIIEINDHESGSNVDLFSKFVRNCMKIQNSKGFFRAVQKNLMRAYYNADERYIKSKEFKKAILKAIETLEKNPCCKFSNIKTLCVALESHPHKKRTKLYTLTTNIRGSENGADGDLNEQTYISHVIGNKRRRVETAVIQSLGNKRCLVESIIDIDDDSAVISIDDDEIQTDSPNEGVDNNNTEKPVIVSDDNESSSSSDNVTSPISVQHTEAQKKNQLEKDRDPEHLENQLEVEWNAPNTSSHFISKVPTPSQIFEPQNVDLNNVIDSIENKILHYQNLVKELEDQEVLDDSLNSPYIQAERYKQQIVKLYQQLCDLTGSPYTKRREVRLKVLNGHPPGPVAYLERFINANIGEDGTPEFPDFSDVVKCVEEAAAHDESMAGWSRSRILQEASGLFTQCGQALQKQRQKREWRSVMRSVKKEEVDYDPADEDPALQAKLAENRKIALKKENDLFERYVIMQNNQNLRLNNDIQGPTQEPSGIQIRDEDDDDDDEEEESDDENELVEEPAVHEPESENNLERLKEPEFYQPVSETNIELPKEPELHEPESQDNIELMTEPELHDPESEDNIELMTEPELHEPESEDNIDHIKEPELYDPESEVNIELMAEPELHEPESEDNIELMKEPELHKRKSVDTVKLFKEPEFNERESENKTESEGRSEFLEEPEFHIPRLDADLVIDETNLNENQYMVLNIQEDKGESSISSQSSSTVVPIREHSDRSVEVLKGTEGDALKRCVVEKRRGVIVNSNVTQDILESSKQKEMSNSIHSNLDRYSNNVLNTDSNADLICDTTVQVKKEKVDITALLLELGDNYTSSIVDILDPFVVIEISSDSSDDDL